MKFFRKINKKILSIVLIAAIAVTTILLSGDTFTKAMGIKEDGTFEFKWGSEVGGEEETYGTFSMKAPDDPYMTNSLGEDLGSFDKNKHYGNPQLDGIKMYLNNWDPGITYNMEKNREYPIVKDQIYLRHHSYGHYSNFSKTYYIVGDDGNFNYEQLWNGFIEYAEEKLIEDEAFWTNYTVHLSKGSRFMYGISQKEKGGALEDAYTIAEKMNQYLAAYLKGKGAVEYNPNSGIDFSDEVDKNETNVTIIRAGMSRVELDYSIRESGYETSWMEQYIPFLMFSVSNYTVKFKMPLNQPKVKALSATIQPVTDENEDIENSIFKDENIRLSFSGNDDITSKKLEYSLFSSDYTISEVAGMNRFTQVEPDEFISLYGTGLSGDYRYLYVRTKLDDKTNQYPSLRDSGIVKYKLNLQKEKSAGTITLKSDADTVDVGDEVTIESSNENAAIFYTTDGTLPEFTLFLGEEGGLQLSDLEAGVDQDKNTVNYIELMDDYNYLKVNGFWYRCSKSVIRYTTPIIIGTEIRQQNRLLVRSRSVESGFELGEILSNTMAYKLRDQVSTPVSDVKTSEEEPAQVQMGSKINLSTGTVDSEIFYTTNGSVPVIVTSTDTNGNTVTQPGNEVTIKYDSNTAITITDALGTYGSNVVIVAKAVSYDGAYRKMRDSEAAKFVYTIGAQLVVEPISSIPATDASNPTTVNPKDKIMLYSKTQGATIYYTTDGSEPVRKKDGSPGKKTKKYNASKGITVPAQKNETLFTITAVGYADGYAVSEVTRIVYKFPDAVMAPYATPSSGVVNEFTNVELKSSTEGAVVYYELATGSDKPKKPTQNSKVFDASNPIVITGQTTINAIAMVNGTSSTMSTFTYQVSSKLSVPTASLQSGSVIASGTNLTLSADDGATIHYTIDGSNPADGENKNVNVGSSVLLEGASGTIITIRAYASKEGFSNSETASFSYSFSNYSEAIFADKESGTVVRNGETVKLNTDVSGGMIHYTTDGSMPNAASPQGNTVVIQGAAGTNVEVKAVVIVPGTTQTVATAVFTYTIMDKLSPPQSNVPSTAIFTEEGQVMLSAPSGTIYYTTDGTQPTKGSSVYKDSITVNRDMTIRAIAISEDADASDVSVFVYTFAKQVEEPEASHESGELILDTEITLSCATEGATIYYTTNGTDPNLDDKDSLNTYSSPIKIGKAMTIKVIASKTGMRESSVLTVGYTVRESPPQEDDKKNQTPVENSNGRLMSRRTFSGEDQGPSYEDIVLKNSTYGVMVSSNFDVIPDETKLNVSRINSSQTGQAMVKQQIGEAYDFVSTFDIRLEVEGEEVQPDGEIELGIPIDPDFENTIIYVVYAGDDGTVEVQETRRSGGMAYAKVTHLSQYSIVAPKIKEEEKKNLVPFIAVGAGIVVVIAVFVTIVVVQRRKYYDR